MVRAEFKLAAPDLQIGFAHRLVALRQTHLQPALLKAVSMLDIAMLDQQLAGLVSSKAMRKLAAMGMRGEAMFAAPMVLWANPCLLTYYRTLLGYSQKEFYQTGTGLGIFRRAEEAGEWSAAASARIPELCALMNDCAWQLLQGIDTLSIDLRFLNELSLLSIGPQLRGGRNNTRGEAGVENVYQVILEALAHAKPAVSGRTATLVNAAGRQVVIEVAADPDIVIFERSVGSGDRPLVAIEVKAGTDVSNIHNRIGEAEKSHLKAKARKFTECWTIVNVNKLDPALAAQQSPTTHRFFRLSELMQTASRAHTEFVASVVALVGIKTKPTKSARTKNT